MTSDDRYDDLDDDELVSAWIDGELPPDVAARVDADPALRARADALRLVAAAVAEPVVPPAGAAEDAVTRAVEGAAPIIPLPRRRATAGRWVAAIAAALLVVVLAAVGLHDASTGTDRSSTAAGPVTTTTTTAATAAARGSAGAANGGAFQGADSAAGADLGDVDGPETLRQRLAAFATVAPSMPSPESATQKSLDTTPCADAALAEARRDGAAGQTSTTATLRYQGTPAIVYVFGRAGDASGKVVVLDLAGCGVRYAGPR